MLGELKSARSLITHFQEDINKVNAPCSTNTDQRRWRPILFVIQLTLQ